ncbi:MAG: TatD family hydrolase [Chthonomonadales bacterium]|nr:TatD family hydrolase [Chthonomonadales bacterium]
MTYLVDTHCHLNHERFADDGGVLDRARAAGVGRFLVVGYNIPSSAEAVQIAEREPDVFAAVAVHPHDASVYNDEAEAAIRAWTNHPRVAAVGEIGLDYHYDLSPREAQGRAFRAQCRIAREAGLPVVVHCRSAYGDTLALLAEELGDGARGVMHCWAGARGEARRALELGLHLGFGGMITFRGAEEAREAAREAPADRVLVETDAPYLAPDPHRGKRNEPAYAPIVASRLAELRGLDDRELAAQTTANAFALFARMR